MSLLLLVTETIKRSSHQNCSVQKCVLTDFANFTGKHLCWNLHGHLHGVFSKKFQTLSLKVCYFIEKGSKSCFPVKFVKFLKALDFKEHLRTTTCESKLLRCIVFIKTMANVTSRGKLYLIIIYSYFFTPDLILQS